MKKFRNKHIKRIFLLMLTGTLLLSGISSRVFASEEQEAYGADEVDKFIPINEIDDEKGGFMINPDLKTTFDDVEESKEIELPEETINPEVLEELQEEPMATRSLLPSAFIPYYFLNAANGRSTTVGIGAFNNDLDNYNVYTTSTSGSVITYLNTSVGYNPDAAVLGKENGRYHIVIAGVNGWISEQALSVYEISDAKSISHYKVNDNGDLIHYISNGVHQKTYSTINNGVAPSKLAKNTTYYSYDGHYFYREVGTMIKDYADETYKNSVNPNDPFYNYFQFLPYRAPSNITSDDLRKFLNQNGYTSNVTNPGNDSVPRNQSMLYGNEKSFIDQGIKYGANGAMTFALAIHESGWGRSYLARDRNNLFGHAAYDKYPGAANKYASIDQSVHSHNTRFLNWHYLDSTEGNYRGGFLGNKQSGMNVRYASDAYWGEKAAAHYLALDRATGSKDYGKFKIKNLQNVESSVTTYTRPEASSQYATGMKFKFKNQSVLVLEEVRGTQVGNSNIWYKISSDNLLDTDGKIFQFYNYPEAVRREKGATHGKDVVYVPASYFEVKKESNYKRGDVNGDGVIDGFDMMAVKRHYLGIKLLEGDSLLAADVNRDGVVDGFDMMAIKRHYLGIKLIED
ncbi:glucosaminidase domain-containing protein [Erysipelothrix inopinata]|uniref:Glucosaminidase domain-containing protein n=1 Tax=Erysipelothrix inopinata TaxID=225084 RepID=A0A7G9RYQ1_9FIRM|nr:glucosaminidase domain-containing protein [Erysipelothrix inopinata]QNN60726.1 glucosaminidase domain-containing protein [Erysipelothrix inopinata]